MIQDTTFIIDVLRGDSDAVTLVELLDKENRPQKLSSVTVFELYEGVGRDSTADAKAERIHQVVDSKPIVDATVPIMRKAGKLSGELITRGNRIDREDCIIAATALLHDEAVLTRNVEHFSRIDGLEVRSY